MTTPIAVEVWSDVVCPWCYIGKRRLEGAVAALGALAPGTEVEITYRSFQLDPDAPRPGEDRSRPRTVEYLADKYGRGAPADRLEQAARMIAQVNEVAAGEGLVYDQSAAVRTNTIDAHRLLHAALAHGGPAMQAGLKERLLAGYFVTGQDLGDADTLVALAAEAGLPGALARQVVDGEQYLEAVRADQELARAIGITGVPFAVVDRRFGISGAQPVEAFGEVLRRALAAREDPST
ncbi:MAG: DsbA family oxidoreductase [Kineosporiaceae bacterium]|nr:DsbA family oxidoreductase [Kineosporiaceae bacterium]